MIRRDGESSFLSPPPEKSLEVIVQFDARLQVGDQRGRAGKPVFPAKMNRVGPLREIYNTYARRDEKGDNVRQVIAEEKEDTSLMSRLETAQFAEDFGVCPGLLRRMDVMYAFKHSDRPDYGPNAPHNREDQLNFDEFAGFIVQCAILGYDHPRHKKEVPDDEAAVDAMLAMLSCTSSDTRKLRARLAEMDRMAKARNDNKSDRKWEHVNRAALGGPTHEAAARVAKGKISQRLIDRVMRFDAEIPDQPKWTEFARPALDCGTLLPGEARRFRVVLRNRNLSGNMNVRVTVEGCPCIDAMFAEGPLAPGLPRIIDITAGSQAPGEWLGNIIVSARPVARPTTEEGGGGGGGAGWAGGDEYGGGAVEDEYVYYEEENGFLRGGGGIDDDDDDDDHRHHGGGDGDGQTTETHTTRREKPMGAGEEVDEGGDWDVHDEAWEERVHVPVYLNCVAKDREVMTRAGATVGISGYVAAPQHRIGFGSSRIRGGGGDGRFVGGFEQDDKNDEDDDARDGTAATGGEKPKRRSSAVPASMGGSTFGGSGSGRPVSAPMRGPTSFRREPEPDIPVEQKLTMKPPRVSSGRVGGIGGVRSTVGGAAAGGGGGGGVGVLDREANMAQATVRATKGPHRPHSGRAQFRLSTGGLRY